jgi:hypothetical protein
MERKISSESRRTILNLGLNWGGWLDTICKPRELFLSDISEIKITSSCWFQISWGLTVSEAIKLVWKLPHFYRSWRFISMFTRAQDWNVSWSRWIQSIPSCYISLRSILTLHEIWDSCGSECQDYCLLGWDEMQAGKQF